MTQTSTVDGPGTGTPIAAVLWDMDGTLVDTEKLWDVALYEVAQWLGGELTEAQRATLVGSNMETTTRFLLGTLGKPDTPELRGDIASWIRTRTAALFGDALPWRPGAHEALTAVRAAGIPSALVTSTERELTELALNTIGREFFDVTVCGDEVGGRNKPDPEPYLLAARLLGVDPARCVAVEDSPPGTESAVAAGCTVLVVPNDVAVDPGPRRVFKETLVGLSPADLADLLG
ncbi:HAD family hydrolase [Amycolatopsis magusensis]|uniref:HAD family hydrolase n=1 Tax=Amycolatopsis magusensis TaxID=882444 RepID=UPI003C300F6D